MANEKRSEDAGDSAINNTGDGSSGHAGRDAGAPSNPGDIPKGWYSRGYLPHLDKPGLHQFITFRLHDAVPVSVIQEWKTELQWMENLPPSDPRVIELHQRIARYEDAGHGACWLRRPDVAKVVENSLLHGDPQRYRLLQWCIMPNHVHVLIETIEGWGLPRIMHTWKSYTATEANHILKRKGPFWFREYYDRFTRDAQHYRNVVSYINQNPVKARLVERAEDWKFSSAYRAATGSATGSAGISAGASSHAGRDADAPSGAPSGAPSNLPPDLPYIRGRRQS